MSRPARVSRRALASLGLGLLVETGACRSSPVRVDFASNGFGARERAAIVAKVEATFSEVRALLPALGSSLTFTVTKGCDVIPETGETATAIPPSTVAWVVCPEGPSGVLGVVASQLRASLFHELHHLVRDTVIPRGTLVDHMVAEGLATAFERDAAGARPPWGEYPPEVDSWVRELTALPRDANVATWLYGRLGDGRRWVGLRAGTYLADRTMRRLRRSAAELVVEPVATFLRDA
ncbi:MAG: DUF2268 domain-containing putative Zn-dependent protease [Polyangiaceae bacterium]